MTTPDINPLENRAYNQAGHATISYLIRYGYAEKYLPANRSLMLPTFETISLTSDVTNWGQLTGTSTSLLTVPQVLVAGYIAEALQNGHPNPNLPQNHPEIVHAQQLIETYIQENMTLDTASRQAQAQQWLAEIFAIVTDLLTTYWDAVQNLATALLQQNTLSSRQVFETIEANISPEAKQNAEAFLKTLEQNSAQALKEMLRQTSEIHMDETILDFDRTQLRKRLDSQNES